MAPPLLTLQGIQLTFGGTPLLTSADLMVRPNDRLCVVGRNGSGKSTLMKIAAGIVEPDGGDRLIKPDVTLRYLEQDPDMSQFSSVRDHAEQGLAPGDDPHKLTRILEKLGLTGDEAPAPLSGGEKRRAALARVLAPEPDILFLDEPTNHLDLPIIEWLEGELARTRSAIVLISHDRRFLENMTRRTIWLDNGTTRELNEGFSAFEGWRDTVIEQAELEQHKLDRKIVREEHWLKYGVTARRKRNVRRLKELEGLRQQRRDQKAPTADAKMTAIDSGQSGKQVIEAKNVSKSYGESPLIKNFSIKINRGDRIGLTGPNGTGKTTLLNILTGQISPDAGAVRLGTKLDVVTLDQQRTSLDPATRLMDTLTDGRGDMVSVGGELRHVMSYMKDFLFQPEQARSPVSALSGGERGRLALAIALAKPSNLLVLDEPTNDLDLETLDLLQELISTYPGTIMLVSHDRDFLDRTVTSTIVPEGNGIWREYPGGYSDMARQRKQTMSEPGSPNKKQRSSAKESIERQNTKSQKLSYKEKYALANLPNEIEGLQSTIQLIQNEMADPSLFTKDPDRFGQLADDLEKAEQSLAAKEELWLELELKQEALSQ